MAPSGNLGAQQPYQDFVLELPGRSCQAGERQETRATRLEHPEKWTWTNVGIKC